MRRKGELSPAAIDRGWPYQVALPASVSLKGGYRVIQVFCKDLSMCPRGHVVFFGGEWFNIYCFAEAKDAEKFAQRFSGERFGSRQRGRGRSWAQWKKP
jgi:hypothetical protein